MGFTRRLAIVAALLSFVATACAGAESTDTTIAEPAAACGSVFPRRFIAETDLDLNQVAGMAVSRTHSGILWVFDAAPEAAELVALAETGGVDLAVLFGASWEGVKDLAIGPGPGDGDYLYVAAQSSPGATLRVSRFAEPDPTAAAAEVVLEAVELPFADGSERTIDAMIVEPESGELYVISSGRTEASLYRTPEPFSAPSPELDLVAELDVGGLNRIEAADLSRDGRTVVMRSSLNALAWERPEGVSLEEALVAAAPCRGELQDAGAEDAIGLVAGSTGFYSVSGGVSRGLYIHQLPPDLDAGASEGGNLVPTVSIERPQVGEPFGVGDTVQLRAGVEDDSEVDEERLSWEVILRECPDGCSVRRLSLDDDGRSFVLPAGLQAPVTVELNVAYADSSGLEGTATRRLMPTTHTLSVESTAPGATVDINGAPEVAPVAVQVVANDSVELGARPFELIADELYAFDAWSDRGAAAHASEPIETDTTLTLELTRLQPVRVVDFGDQPLRSFGGSGLDGGAPFTVEDDGSTLRISGNGWKRIELPYRVGDETLVVMRFSSGGQGLIHGFGFDPDRVASPENFFRFYGTANWGIGDFANYAELGSQAFVVPIGAYISGSVSQLHFASYDPDAAESTAESVFSDVRFYELPAEALP